MWRRVVASTYRDLDDHGRTALPINQNGERAAKRSHTFLNTEQTEAARLGEGRVFDPDAVVDDLHRDRMRFGSQYDIGTRGPGVPSYIRQRLLGGPEQDEAGLFRDRADRRDFDDPDGEPRNLAEIPRVFAERYRQRQVGQRIWLKIIGHPASRTHAIAEPLREFQTGFLDVVLIGGPRLNMFHPELQCEQILRNAFMQILGDGAALILSDRLKTLNKLADSLV